MKKLLTVVLCIAVIFTFSFSTSFAASTYTKDDWNNALTSEYNSIVEDLEAYQATVLRGISFNDDGFTYYDTAAGATKDTFVKGLSDGDAVKGYTKDVLQKVLNDICTNLEDVMRANKTEFLTDESAYYTVNEQSSAVAKTVLLGTFKTDTYSSALGTYTAVNATAEGLLGYLQNMSYQVDTDSTVAKKLAEYQVSVTYDYIVNTLLNVDLSKYNDEDKDYYYSAGANAGKVANGSTTTAASVVGAISETATHAADEKNVTAADAIDQMVDDTKDALLDVKNCTSYNDTKKLTEYQNIYAAYYNQYVKVMDKDDKDYADATTGSEVSSAIDAYAAHGYNQASALINGVWGGSDTENWSSYVTTGGILKEFWTATGTGTKDGKLFDVAIANIEKVTRTEATAVYNAMKAEVDNSKVVLQKYIDNKNLKSTTAVAAIGALYDGTKSITKAAANTARDSVGADQKKPNDETFMKTLKRAMKLQDLYDDIKEECDKLKAQTKAGVKQYNDAKVAELATEAEEWTYGHIADNLTVYTIDETIYSVIYETLNDIYDNNDGLANIQEDAAKQAIKTLDDAITDAIEKMWNSESEIGQNGGQAKRVRTGADKTPDEDLVYLAETYASEETASPLATSDWGDIAVDAANDLLEAQSYEEIDKIMAQAKADFEGLLTKANESDVTKARDAYKKALKGYIDQCKELLDDSNAYTYAYNHTSTGDNCLLCKGSDLIDDGNTVDGVKAAYADAQKLVDNAKSNDQLKSLRRTAENLIDALPNEDKIVADDLTKMEEAYAAVKAYMDEAGSYRIAISNLDTLKTKYEKALAKKADELKDEAEALWDKMDAVNTKSDADLTKFAAYKAEAQALQDKVSAIDDTLDDIEDDAYLNLSVTDFDGALKALSEDYASIAYALSENRNVVGKGNTSTIWGQEVENAKRLLVVANKPGATAAEIKAAQDAYNALTQRQQLCIDEDAYYYNLVNAVIDKDATSVEEIKIIAKSVAKKGSITVTWKIKSGDATNIDGYEIWKSTKHSKGYKKAFTTTNKSYKNTKGLKKGTRYYYKVRAYKVIDGTKYTSDWSNKARRIAK